MEPLTSFPQKHFGKDGYAHYGRFIQWNNYSEIKRNELQMIQFGESQKRYFE